MRRVAVGVAVAGLAACANQPGPLPTVPRTPPPIRAIYSKPKSEPAPVLTPVSAEVERELTTPGPERFCGWLPYAAWLKYRDRVRRFAVVFVRNTGEGIPQAAWAQANVVWHDEPEGVHRLLAASDGRVTGDAWHGCFSDTHLALGFESGACFLAEIAHQIGADPGHLEFSTGGECWLVPLTADFRKLIEECYALPSPYPISSPPRDTPPFPRLEGD